MENIGISAMVVGRNESEKLKECLNYLSFYNIFYQFFRCYFTTKGYKDGFIGLFLSLFWVWYSTSSNISLYSITKRSSNHAKD